MLKICEKNSSVNLRLEIFVMAFRVRKLFGTFEKRAPGLYCITALFSAPPEAPPISSPESSGLLSEQQPIKKIKNYSRKFHYPRVSPGDQPLTKSRRNSGLLWARDRGSKGVLVGDESAEQNECRSEQNKC